MRTTLPFIELATGAALPSSLGAEPEHELLANGATVQDAQAARARADKLRAGLPPLVDEDVRIVGALAEFFAAAAAERLMNAGLRLGAGTGVYGRASTEARRKAMRPTLRFIAFATGAALCAPVLAQQASPRPNERRIGLGQRLPGSSDNGHGDPGRSWARSRRKATPISSRSGASPGTRR